MKSIIFLFLMTVSMQLFAETTYLDRTWGGSQMLDHGLPPKQYGFKGRYNPWENIQDYKKGYEDQVEEVKPDPYIFGSEKPEVEWYSDERMGRASKEKANSKYFKEQEQKSKKQHPYQSPFIGERLPGGEYDTYTPYKGYSPFKR